MSQSDDIASGSNAHPNIRPYENQLSPRRASGIEYPPPIPVALRHPRIVTSVKQYRSEAQQQQLQQHIVSESFIPVAPGAIKPPRRRRRPPFSYSALIAQAILESENERMTLREIYKWIMNKYPALYDASDTGWQNTIRHNLSLNKCFKKEPRVEGRGKGGYWTVDPEYKARFRNGTFINTTPSLAVQHKQPREIRAKEPEKDEEAADTDDHTSSSPETVRCDLRNPHSPLFIASEYQQLQQLRNLHYTFKTTNPPEEHGKPPQQPLSASSIPLFSTSTSCASTPSHTSVAPPSIPSSSSPSQVMQIHNLLN